MTEEQKNILLQDLCARLPYGVKVQTDSTPRKMIAMDLWDINSLPKPYLRPMSSMTDDEKGEIAKIATCVSIIEITNKMLEFCCSHHLDWRGLIPMGLALEAPEGMYNI